MSDNSAVEGLRASRAAASSRKRYAVQQALNDSLAAQDAITPSSIAARAGVSRQFLYSHPDLIEAVRRAAKQLRDRTPRVGPRHGPVQQGLRADHQTLTAKVARQRTTIAEQRSRIEDLEQQRQRWLGSQLDARLGVSPEEHAELRAACDRLMSDKTSLMRRVTELERLNAILETDLVVSREAHQADMMEFGLVSADTLTVMPNRPSATDR